MSISDCNIKCAVQASSNMASVYDEFIVELRKATASASGDQPLFIQTRETAYKLAARGLLKEALTEYTLALELYQQEDVKVPIYATFVPLLLNEMGLLCIQQGYPQEALTYCSQALAEIEVIYAKFKTCSIACNLYLHSLKNKAVALRVCNLYNESLDVFNTLLVLLLDEKDKVLRAECLYHVGELYNLVKDYANAEDTLKQCIAIRKEVFGYANNAAYTCSSAKHICLPLFMLAVVLSTPEVARFTEARQYMCCAQAIQTQCRDLELQKADSEEGKACVLNHYNKTCEWFSKLKQCIEESERKVEEEMNDSGETSP